MTTPNPCRRFVAPVLATAAFALIVAGPGSAAQAQSSNQAAQPDPAQPRFSDAVEVVGATPIQGLGIDRDKVPANVQVITSDALTRTGGVSVSEQMTVGAQSVHANEATTNPFQPDLQFRGFVGSPLLGLPQGIAVYQNGVRLNEPFGDTVNWDLMPTNAVASLNLMPGSNPLFGLNALGGAISVQTKTGFTHAGHAARYQAGSFGRQMIQAETGGNNGRVSYFAAGTFLDENGWRAESPSQVRQLFGDVEWRGRRSTLNATVTSAANQLVGNGAAPTQLLDEDRTAIFTYPDETTSKMTMLTLRGHHAPKPTVSFDGVAFYRRASIRAFNGDDSNYDACEDPALTGFLCSDEGEGEPVEDQLERLIPVDDDDELNGTNNTSRTVTNGWGGSLQATVTAPVARRANHFVTGVTFDGGRSGYQADTEIARLTEARGTVGTGLFDEEAVVRLRTRVSHVGAYLADFFTVAPRVTLMGSARVNHSRITLRDQIGTELNGDHSFTRVNPAVGATVSLSPEVTAYGSLSMSSRAPAPSELSCADPEDPCRLPNAFVADPPLEQVVARTLEGGLRGGRAGVSWNASVFQTANRDDIMFISSGPLRNTGHFENVGDTLRTGLELGAAGSARAVQWGLAYSFLRARFDTALTLSSPNHPDEEDGEIEVEAGDRLPGVPQHNLKANLSGTIRRLTLGGSLLRTSSQYLRADEANLLPAIDGFTLANATASYALARQVRLTGRITNIFGSKYSTFGLLGEADEVLGDDYDDPRFLSPGAPRAAWVGLEISFR